MDVGFNRHLAFLWKPTHCAYIPTDMNLDSYKPLACLNLQDNES